MDNDIRRLVEKRYKPRGTSTVQVPNDETLKKLLSKVANTKDKTLSWTKGTSPRFEERLEGMGFKLRESSDCWLWTGWKADNGTRPNFGGKQAYLFTIAAFDNKELTTSENYDTDHRCGNSQCVRPGPNHASINLRAIHERTGQQDGARPKAQRKPKAKP